jgi:hypothetical protein
MEDTAERPSPPIGEGPPNSFSLVIERLFDIHPPAFCLALVIWSLCTLAAIVWLHSWIATKFPA